MIDPGIIFYSIRGVTKFTVTDDHLKLLRRAHITWDGVEFGAPEIYCKKPYGNSNVWGDIAEILEVPDSEWETNRAECSLILRCASPGCTRRRRSHCRSHWPRVSSAPDATRASRGGASTGSATRADRIPLPPTQTGQIPKLMVRV
jgi:hypothetical protein